MAQSPLDPSLSKTVTSIEAKDAAEATKLTAGRKYVGDFSLSYEATIIDDQPDEAGFTLHQRLEVLQSYYFKNYGNSGRNIIVANIGFVISDASDTSSPDQKKFISFPIDDASKLIIAANPDLRTQRHSENALREHLEDLHNIKEILRKLNDFYKKKVKRLYAIIIDLNSTREMCGFCDKTIHHLQNPEGVFLKTFNELLKKFGIMRGEDGKLNLNVTMRISGFLDANLFNSNLDVPQVIESFDRNVQSHHPNAILHLAPQNSRFEDFSDYGKYYSRTYVQGAGTNNVKGQRAMRLAHESIKTHYLQPGESITLKLQTGFKSNFSKREGSIKKDKNDTQVTLTFQELSELRLHQIWYDWTVIEKEFTCLGEALPPQGLSIIKSYLYGEPKEPSQSSLSSSMENLSIT